MHKTCPTNRTRPRICPRARKDGLRSYEFDAANRLADVTTGAGIDAPTTRYVHNALGQRLFKTEPLYAPVSTGSNPNDPGVIQVLVNFFASLWGGNTATATPSTSEKLGYQYYYDEDGNLLYELGAGGAQSTGNAHYIYLPTPSGPMPIAAVINAKQYAVHTDHLNTPRRLTQSDKRVAWQWAFSAFGDEQPTTGKNRYVDPVTTPNAGSTTIADVTFNLRYPGQYFDKESNLNYNYFRSYDSRTGRYTQSDPIGLDGGWNRFAYVDNNPLKFIDPLGLAVELRCRPADIAAGLVNHCWLKTDSTEAGMNEQASCSRAGNDASGFPFQPVVVSDHSCDKPTIVTPLPNVNESCVNGELQLGRPLRRFAPPFNSCQTFTQDVIQKCSPNNTPYIGYPGVKKAR